MRALSDYLALQYVPAPETIFEGIFELPSAHTIELARGGEPGISRHLPKHLLERRKMGFSLPNAERFRDPRRDFLREALLDSATVRRGIIDAAGVEQRISDHAARRDDHNKRFWVLATRAPWFHAFAENERPVIRSAA